MGRENATKKEARPRPWPVATVAVAATLAVMVVAGPVAHAAKANSDGGTTQATLSAPYGAVERGYCGPAADPATGRFVADPLTGPASCLTRSVRESSSYFGSNNPLTSTRTITANLRVNRVHVPVPRDPYFYAILAVAPGFRITSDSVSSRFFWCRTAGLLTQSETQSLTPVTVTNREVTATCSFAGGASLGSSWVGIALRYSNGVNPVELDATLTSIVVKS